MKKSWIIGAAALTALTPAAVVQAAEADIVRALTASEHEARGDLQSWVEELLGAIETAPDTPAAAAALWKVYRLMDTIDRPEVVEERLTPLATRGVRDGDVDEILRDVLWDRARTRGDFDGAAAVGANQGYLRRWAVIGPFGSDNAAMIHKRFGPEAEVLDMELPQKGRSEQVRWRALMPRTTSVYAYPYEQIRNQGSAVAYAVSAVESERPQDVAVKVMCSGTFRVWVNGHEVALGDRRQELTPDAVWGTARLVSGKNRVLVKVVGDSSFAVKLCDPSTGLPLGGVSEGDPLRTFDLPEVAPGSPRAYRTPSERLIDATSSDPATLYVAAEMAREDGREWDAYELYEQAVAGAMTLDGVLRANLHAGYGRFLQGFDEFPAVDRKLRAKEQFEAAVAADPLHLSANLRLASYLDEDDHPDKAMVKLEEYVGKNPAGAAFLEMAQIAKKRDWQADAIRHAEAAVGVMPRLASAEQLLAEFDTNFGNWDAYARRQRRLLEIDADDTRAAQNLIRVLRNQGEHEEALRWLETLADRHALSVGWRREHADVLTQLDRLDEALAEWRELEQLIPAEDEYPRRVGEILELKGDRDGAIAAYERSLDDQAYQPLVWRRLERLRGENADFAAAFEPDAQALIDALPSTEELQEQYPEASAVTVLDHMVTRVRPDGSSTSYVHMVYKVLNEKGVAKYGDLDNTGELLDVEAIQPDGTVMKPTGLRGSRFNVEGLVPGTVLRHRFLMHDRGGPDGFDNQKFYFQDFQFRDNPNPVQLSRWVVISPEDMTLEPRTRNYRAEPETRELDGHVATIWEKRDMPRIEPEFAMPEADEIVPVVDYTQPPTFEDANWSYLSSWARTWPTPMIEDRLADVVTAEMGDLEKLHAIYDFVNAEITSDFGGGSTATSVLMEKAGNRSTLFEAMIRAADIPFRRGRVMANEGETLDLDQLDTNAFRTPFLWLEPRDAEPIAFFMAARSTPFGLVPAPFRGSFAYLASVDGGEIVELAEGGPEIGNLTEFEVTLGATAGDTTVRGRLVYRDPNAYRLKKQLLEAPEDARQKFAESQLTSYFANPTLTNHDFPQVAENGVPPEIRLEGTMPTYLAEQGGVFVAGLGLPTSDMAGNYVGRDTRKFDLVLQRREDSIEEYVIHLGDAFRVRSLPEDHVTVHKLGTYSLTWRNDGDTIRVRRERHFRPARYTPEQYPRFVAWCKSIDDAEQRKLQLVPR